jgi:hypothetical protein
MSTSGSTDFTINRNTLIKGALRLVGAIAQGEEPTADQILEASEALNMLVKAWQADGMPLWAVKEYSLPLTSSVASYEIGIGKTINTPKPLKMIEAFRRETSTNIDVPIRLITRQEYNSLGNKTSSGIPIQLWYEPKIDYGVLTVYPTPDSTSASNYTIKLFYQRPFEDFDSSVDTPDFPAEWYDAVKYGLATRLAGDYGIPLEDRRELKAEAAVLKSDALGFGNEEGSYYFQPDKQEY